MALRRPAQHMPPSTRAPICIVRRDPTTTFVSPAGSSDTVFPNLALATDNRGRPQVRLH